MAAKNVASTKNKKPKKKVGGKRALVPSIPQEIMLAMFADYCDNMALREIAKKYDLHHARIGRIAKKEGWEQRRAEIQSVSHEELKDRIIRCERNNAMLATVIQEMNQQQMLKEIDVFQEGGPKPSFVGSDLNSYRDAFELAEKLLKEDKKHTIDINEYSVQEIRRIPADQMEKVLDLMLAYKGIPKRREILPPKDPYE